MLKHIAKRVVKSVALPLVDATGWYGRPIDRLRASTAHWTIVMYHRVIDDPALDPFSLGMCVRRSNFERQIEYFARRFKVMSVRDAMARVTRGEALPAGTLSITFDDGYADNLHVALPIMERYHVPCTLFVPSGGMPGGESLWWDRVISAIAGTRRPSISAQEVGLPHGLGTLSLAAWQRSRTAQTVLDTLWTLPFEQLIVGVARLEQALQPQQAATSLAPRLTPQMIRQMHQRGVEIGAHSVWHSSMPLGEGDDTQREMAESKRYLEQDCGVPVEGFAYPGGRVNEQTVAAARAAGFSYAVADASAVNVAPYSAHLLSRIGMPDAPVVAVKRSLSRAARNGGVF